LITGADLIATLPTGLDDIVRTGNVYLVNMGKGREAGPVISGLVNPAGEVIFVFGPPAVLGKAFALVDDCEYGWPRLLEATEVRAAQDLMPGHRDHPVLRRGNELLAMSISLAEYELLPRDRQVGGGPLESKTSL
jgi:hypothetical protein